MPEVQRAEGWGDLRSLVAPACLTDNNWWAGSRPRAGRRERWAGRCREGKWHPGQRRQRARRGVEGRGRLLHSQAGYLGQLTRGQGYIFFFLECLLGGQEFILTPIGGVSGKEYVKKKKKSVEDSCSVLAALSLHIFLFMRFCLSDLSMF